jgi:hypothetical protein
MFRRISVASVVLALGFALAAPSWAAAANTVGETFDPSGGSNCSPAQRTFLQLGPAQYVVPSSGVLTSWSHLAAGSPPQLNLTVARHQTGNDYLIVGHSPLESPAANTLNTFPTRIPVEAGDVIGLHTETLGQCFRFTDATYQWASLDGPDPTPGNVVTFGAPGPNAQFDIAARLESDADRDGFGDETQDQCPTNASIQSPCPVKKKKCKHKKRHKRAAVVSKKCKKKHH